MEPESETMTRRIGPTIATAVLSLALVATPANALGPSAGAAKAKACKAGQVPVTVGKKTTCKPLAKAIPEPKAIDIRLAHLQEALKLDPAKAVKGKKRKRIRTLQSGFGAAGKRAQKKLLKMLPKALAFVDQKGGAHSSSLPTGLALASSSCEVGPAGPTGHAAGGSLGALGDNGGYIETSAGGGLRVRVTFVSCKGANNWGMPPCPTANGSVDGSATGEFRVTIEVLDRSGVVSRNSNIFQTKAKAHGEVGPDARLKFVEIEHTEEVFIVATGPSGPVVIRGGVTRSVKIAMPGGKLDPAAARVRYFGDSFDFKSGAEAFASSAASALGAYEYVEPGWSTFNPKGGYCAEPVFSPDSNTLKLKKNDSKQLGIYAKARQDGGRATGAKWTLLGAENANFSPTSSEDPAPNVSYTVTNAPPGGQVRVTVKFTSTAGVGEKTWTQPTEQDPIRKISGNFSGETVIPTSAGPSVYSWSGGATLERTTPDVLGGPNGAYSLIAGSITYHVSGIEGLASACHWSGTAVIGLPHPSGGGGAASVFGTLPELTEPYEYGIQVTTPPPPAAEIEFTRSNCPEGADELEGTTDKISYLVAFNTGQQISADGIHYAGSTEENQGGATMKQSWVFEATP
jgi:hypothetical protein